MITVKLRIYPWRKSKFIVSWLVQTFQLVTLTVLTVLRFPVKVCSYKKLDCTILCPHLISCKCSPWDNIGRCRMETLFQYFVVSTSKSNNYLFTKKHYIIFLLLHWITWFTYAVLNLTRLHSYAVLKVISSNCTENKWYVNYISRTHTDYTHYIILILKKQGS